MHKIYIALGAFGVLLWAIVPCGPEFIKAPLTLRADILNKQDFAAGDLGILQPTFRRRYLAVAYQLMTSDKPPGRDTLAAMKLPVYVSEGHKLIWQKRAAAYGQAEKIRVYRQVPGETYQYFENCLQDSFRQAVVTLDQLSGKYGKKSSQVKEWVASQGLVYQNCSGASPALPVPLKKGPLVKYRDYQVAAAHFYATNYQLARDLFLKIAKDQASPFQSWGFYLAARSHLRLASFGQNAEENFRAALKLLKRAAKNKEKKKQADRLVTYIDFRTNKERLRKTLAYSLANRLPSGEDASYQVQDLVLLLDELGVEPVDYFYSVRFDEKLHGSTKYKKLGSVLSQHDLIDFIITFQANSAEAEARAIRNYQKKKTLPWLVAVLSKVHVDNAVVPSVLKAARLVKPDSPAYMTVTYHSLRLQAEQKKYDQVHSVIDRLLNKKSTKRNFATFNLLQALKMRHADTMNRFIQALPRKTAQGKVYIDADGGTILTEMFSLENAEKLIKNSQLSINLKILVSRAFWVRSILLNNAKAGVKFGVFLIWHDKKLKPIYRTYLKPHGKNQFQNLLTLLRNPGLRPFIDIASKRYHGVDKIDSLRDNWWCSFAEKPGYETGYDYYKIYNEVEYAWAKLYPGLKIVPPPFLTRADLNNASTEMEKLAFLGPAPNYLAEKVLAEARRNKTNPALPEALHRVVKATRYGCTNEDSGSYSHRAFLTLHKWYPESPYVQKTPYWFK